MAKGTKLARLGIKRLPGTMYYIKEQAVWSVPRGGGRKVRVARFDQPVPPGTLCYVDRDGDVACAPRAKPGARRKKAPTATRAQRVSTDRSGHGILRDARGRNPRLYLRPEDATAALIKDLKKLTR